MSALAARRPSALAGPEPAAAETAALVARVRDLEQFQRATLNILEDLEDERSRYEQTQRATFNILDDLDGERGRIAETQRATLNILDDLHGERARLEDMQRATFNILDDLGAEKERTEAANTRLATEVALRTRAEHDIAAKAAELTRSNDELQQFAYVASHDLQEPLRTVRGAVNHLAKAYAGKVAPDDEKYVRFALDGAARMQRLVEDLLALSRVGTHGSPPVDVSAADCALRAVANLRGTIEETGAEVVVASLPRIHADEGQIVQLFQNLVGNGIKFHSAARPHVEISATTEGPMVHVVVKDNGIGIDPQYHERVFVIFQRLHARDKYPGTGIGLAIVKKIVERHGGRIWIVSRVGDGAEFHFTLPKAGA